jgi:hypothetical protein
MIIDSHAHIGRFNAWPLARGEPEELVRMLRAEGIDYALVSSAHALYYDCRLGNAETLAAAARHPELLPLLCVNPRRGQEAREELGSRKQRGFVGVKLHPTSHECSLTSDEAEVVLDHCERQQVPVLTHSSEEDPRCDPRAIAEAARRHPGLALVVGHACLFSSREVVAVAEQYPNVHLELSVNYEAGKLEDTVARLGTSRLLFGSDAPLHHPSVMLQRIRVMGLGAADEERLLSANARRVYSLGV